LPFNLMPGKLKAAKDLHQSEWINLNR